MTIWTPDISVRGGPKYLAIADAIAEAVSGGSLSPGAKLPPQRNLAYDLGVTLGTVTRAYAEAERRGLVEGEVGRGTFVRSSDDFTPDGFIAAETGRPGTLDLTQAVMPVGPAGRLLAETIREIADEPNIDELATYQMNTGLARHIEAASRWLGTRGLNAEPDRVSLTSGAQNGNLATLMTLLRPGDSLLVESLTFPSVLHAARQLGYGLEPVAIDEEGLVPEALDAACRRSSARVLYCIPTVHNPTTGIMSEGRRREIIDIARRHDVLILEDNIWGENLEDPPTAIAALAPERTFYITGLAKCLAGGLRTGFVLCPPGYAQRYRASLSLINWMPAPLTVEVGTRWLTSSQGREMVEWRQRETKARAAIAEARLGAYGPRINEFAAFIWLPLPAPWRGLEFKSAAEAQNIRILAVDAFVSERNHEVEAVRIATGGNITRAELDRGLAVLAEILAAGPDAAHSFV